MSRKLLVLSATATLLGSAAFADAPKVVADIAPVYSLVARVMDGVGTPDLVVPAGSSPHGYSLRPSEAAALQDADLVFWVGDRLTPWLTGAIETLSENATATELLEVEGVTLLEFRESALFEKHSHGDDHHDDHDDEHAHEEGHDHSHNEDKAHDHDHDKEHDHAHDKEHDDEHHDHAAHGDDHKDHDHNDHAAHDDHDDHAHDGHHDHDHSGADPHAWLSLDNAAVWVDVIAQELASADPENASIYSENAASAKTELASLKAEIDVILEPVRDRNFIVFHDAYQYFEVTFGMSAAGAISMGDASDPGPARIREIQGRIVEQEVSCVLSEPQFNPGMVATVMAGSAANTTVVDPLGVDLELGPNLYPQLLRNLATSLADCL